MKIRDEHLYHGAALTQIAEHKSFTAINAYKVGGSNHRSVFRVNDNIGVYLKYSAAKPIRGEYIFTFTAAHIADLKKLANEFPRLFIGLVCVKGEEIACLSHQLFGELIQERVDDHGSKEQSYSVIVTLPAGQQIRAYMNASGVKRRLLKEHLIPRKSFPDSIFQ